MNMIMIKEAAATLDRTAADEGVQLQSLTLSEGSIRFEPDVTEYSITVDEGTERIRVKAVTSDAQSTYTVSGYDKLKSGNNDIVITVTDKDGDVGYYYVHVFVEGGSDAVDTQNQSNEAPDTALKSKDGFEEILSNVSEEISAFVKGVSSEVSLGLSSDFFSGDLHFAALGVAGCGLLAALLWIIIFVRHAAAKRRYRKESRMRRAQREAKKKQWELAQTQQDILLRQVDELLERDRKEHGRTGYSGSRSAGGYGDYDDYAAEDYDDYTEDEAGLDDWLGAANDESRNEDR